MKLPRRKFLHLTACAAALPAVSRVAWSQAIKTPTGRLKDGPTQTFSLMPKNSWTAERRQACCCCADPGLGGD